MIIKIGKLSNMGTFPVWQMVSTRLSSLSSAPSPSKRSLWSFFEICKAIFHFFCDSVDVLMLLGQDFDIYVWTSHQWLVMILKLLFEFKHSLTGSIVLQTMFMIAVYEMVNDGQLKLIQDNFIVQVMWIELRIMCPTYGIPVGFAGGISSKNFAFLDI